MQLIQDVLYVKSLVLENERVKVDKLWEMVDDWKKNMNSCLYEICEEEIKETYFDSIQLDPSYYLIVDGFIVGFMIYKVLDYHSETDGILIIAELVAVHPDHRKEGYGRYIMKQWEKKIRSTYLSSEKTPYTSDQVTIILHDTSGVGGFYWRLGYSDLEKYTHEEQVKYIDIIAEEEDRDDDDDDDIGINDVFIKKLYTS